MAQQALFDLLPSPTDSSDTVQAAERTQNLYELAACLPQGLHLGTSSWSFPGWQGLVWAHQHTEQQLAAYGLPAYASHPLLRTVSLDSSFYRPLPRERYAQYAAQVPAHFRWVVKAPALLTDALIRSDQGRAAQANPAFLDPEVALTQCWEPVSQGLGQQLGALVLQFSPMPHAWTKIPERFYQALDAVLAALDKARATEPVVGGARRAVIAVELRDANLMRPELAALLRARQATWCLAGHPRMPSMQEQLPMLRALWPGPLVARWNLNSRHGPSGYSNAKALYAPFNRLVDPDLETRATLARVASATALAGHPVFITINNKAEGSAPLSVQALAQAIAMHTVKQSDNATSDRPQASHSQTGSHAT